MLVDLVQVTTSDGIPLSGAYFEAKGSPASGADVLIYFHGDSGNFYGSLLTQLGPMFAERGMAFLAANRRGHDMVSTGVRGGDLKGYAFESVSESRLDYAAWLDLLRGRGHRRIAVGGHSGGAVRATYAQASEHYDNVAAVVSVSPGEYNHEKVVAVHGEDFSGPYRQSETDITEGRPDTFLRPGVPWGSMWTARSYVDCFNKDNRYSVSAHAANTGVPTLYVFGEKECDIGGEEELPVCGLAMRTLREIDYSHATVKVVEGANHGYMGREKELMETIYPFLSAI